MNVLLVSHDFTVTGAPNSLLRQAIYLRDAGHDVDVWGLGDGRLKDRYIEKGFNPKVIKNDFQYIKKAWKKRKINYDFIICNTIVTYKAVDFLQRQNVPLVWFIRETKLVDEGIKNNPDFAKVFSKFYNIYTVSDYAGGVCKKYNNNVRIINNAVEDKFRKYKKTNKKIVFGYIGSIIPVKGVDILVNAFNKLIQKHKNIQLNIAGSTYNEYAQKIKKQSNSQIKYLGEIQGVDKQKFFDDIDILIVPSLDEPSGLTVVEAVMYGKPVITTDKTGAKYMVHDDKNGYIVKTGDVDNLYKYMEKILTKDLDKMKRASRKIYFEKGTTDKECKNVLKMVEDNKNNLPIIRNRKLNRFSLIKKVWYYFCGIKTSKD